MHNPRLDGLPDYPFPRLNHLLAGIAPGRAPLLLSLGEPRHPVPALVGQAIAAAPAADWGRYPPHAGTPALCEAIAAWLTRRYGLPAGMIAPEAMILPVSGTREALYMAGAVLIPPDKGGRRPLAVMPNPFYQVYLGSALMHGAEPLLVDAGPDTGFLPDLAALPSEVLDRAAVVTLCSPANPQGAVAGPEQWKTLVRLAREHDFVLIADECYSEIYDRDPPPGVLEACRDLGGGLANVLVFNSLSKRSSVPGLRAGFVAGDPALIARFLRLRSYAGAGMPLPLMAAATALWADEAHVAASRALYREKIDDAEAILGAWPGFRRPAGGFFLWLDVAAAFGDGETAARRLWAEAGVKVLPGRYLARDDAGGGNVGDAYIRLALVEERAATAEALHRIADLARRG